MNVIDVRKFAMLAKNAQNTEYYQNAKWATEEIEDIINYLDKEDSELDEYTDEDLLTYLEELVFDDETQMLPPEIVYLADYVYNCAVILKDAPRINNYGTLFYMGRIQDQNFNKAAYYYQIASDLGSSQSIENLGYIYYYGRTGKIDYERAYQLFSKGSAVYNRACSTYKLGDMFKNGYYVTQDTISAFQCYKRSESLINNGQDENEAEYVAPDIYFRLAECYHYGKGTDKNLIKAQKYYQKAERGFIKKIRLGNFLVKKMLLQSIERQNEIREVILNELPEMEWAKNNKGYKDL